MRTIETDRLLLHPWREADRVELARLLSDPVVKGGRHLTPARIGALSSDSLRQWRVNGFGPWAAVDKVSGRWIGRIGLDELDDWPEIDKVEVGFELHREWNTISNASSVSPPPRTSQPGASWRRPDWPTRGPATGRVPTFPSCGTRLSAARGER